LQTWAPLVLRSANVLAVMVQHSIVRLAVGPRREFGVVGRACKPESKNYEDSQRSHPEPEVARNRGQLVLRTLQRLDLTVALSKAVRDFNGRYGLVSRRTDVARIRNLLQVLRLSWNESRALCHCANFSEGADSRSASSLSNHTRAFVRISKRILHFSIFRICAP
jgi:hypothetical protein